MKQFIVFIVLMSVFLNSCEKPENRKCWKGEGEQTELTLGLDSINSFRLEKNIKYNFYESTEKKMIVRGGENMVNQISLNGRS